ncbi:MAG TPA: hypothetical protein VLM42_06210 [Bryobacteraceae bacterium]|nr:hypothetical protein [Bryobacteraceae bacterium]
MKTLVAGEIIALLLAVLIGVSLGALGSGGSIVDDVIAAEGSDFVALEKEETGLGNFLMQELSRFVGAEQISTDHNLEFAHSGAAFLVVHCPTEKTKKEAWDAMKLSAPLAAHYYSKRFGRSSRR